MSPKDQLTLLARSMGGVPEFLFHPDRKWRLDWAWPAEMVAVEYNGHHSTGRAQGRTAKTSGHSSITGITNDAEKGNEAARLGWKVIRLTALHFRPESRAKHKLQSPHEILRQFLNP